MPTKDQLFWQREKTSLFCCYFCWRFKEPPVMPENHVYCSIQYLGARKINFAGNICVEFPCILFKWIYFEFVLLLLPLGDCCRHLKRRSYFFRIFQLYGRRQLKTDVENTFGSQPDSVLIEWCALWYPILAAGMLPDMDLMECYLCIFAEAYKYHNRKFQSSRAISKNFRD